MTLVMHILFFLFGLILVCFTLYSAVQTFVLPRSAPDPVSRLVFVTVRRLFMLRLKRARTYEERDRVMAFFAPVSLLCLLPTWLALLMIGYAGMYWGLGVQPAQSALKDSGFSLLTLGFPISSGFARLLVEFSEATIGLMMVALLIAYLPTMYSAFSRRESAVTLLEVRAGSPPSAVQMLLRYRRIHGFDELHEVWKGWETWFADIEESHTSLAALVFFRSPQPKHSWVTAAGAVLDTAALTLAAVDIPHDPQADLCIRAGYLALRHISDTFDVHYNSDPRYPNDPISVSREEFEHVLDELAADDVPIKPNRDQAWRDFAGWRVNYDTVLLALAGLTMAPEAPWSSDRATFTLPALTLKPGNQPER